ncbi:AMP-binding protein [Mycobacteroides abscessus]|uniref:AMP-binding protein n=1 Tax=Mycobacteroides abscessus TaxID=36809 RepID=UPI0021063483|nr:AMP-binding protein [Mycobacteroides abscessus]
MKALRWLDDPSDTSGMHFDSGRGVENWEFVSYRELAQNVAQTATLLVESGLEPGDVVSIVPSHPRDFVAAFYGAIVAGGTPSPVATPLTFRSLEVYIEHLARIFAVAEPALILVDGDLADTVVQATTKIPSFVRKSRVIRFGREAYLGRDELTRRNLAEHVLLQFTSGSSGTPKGVQVTPANLDANIGSIVDWLGVTSEAVAVSWLPFYHDMGLVGMLLTPLAIGAQVRLLTPGQFLRSPRRWLECLSLDEGFGCTAAPSFGYAYTARRVRPQDIEQLDFSRWQTAVVGAERMDPTGIENFLELACPRGFEANRMVAAYGLAESVLAVTGTKLDAPVPLVQLEKSAFRDGEPVIVTQQSTVGAVGRCGGAWVAGCGTPVSGSTVDIIDENGAVLPEGHHGQVRVRSQSVTDGYRKVSTHSSTSFAEDGLYTGDTGFLLGDELFVVGRTGDSIKVRGAKLFAEDLDARVGEATGLSAGRYAVILGTATDIDAVVVVIESDESGWQDTWTESVKSIVTSTISERVGYAVFRGERGVIERTSSGKPRRRVLWQRLLDADLPVDLVCTNWAEISNEPEPWANVLADSAGP